MESAQEKVSHLGSFNSAFPKLPGNQPISLSELHLYW